GDFTSSQTTVVAASLAAFALGLAFNGAMLMLNRAFFSLQAAWVPTGVALAAVFYRFGIWGIPLSTSIVNIVGTVVLLVLLRRKLGRLDITRTMSSVLRISLASLVLAGVAYGIWWPLDHELGRRFVA